MGIYFKGSICSRTLGNWYYSPELQPAERLWPLTNEPIANRCFESLDELEVVLFERCRRLLQQQDLIRGLTFFHCCPGSAEEIGSRTSTIARTVLPDLI